MSSGEFIETDIAGGKIISNYPPSKQCEVLNAMWTSFLMHKKMKLIIFIFEVLSYWKGLGVHQSQRLASATYKEPALAAESLKSSMDQFRAF